MELIPYIIILLVLSPFAIFIIWAGMHLLYLIVSYESYKEAEESECQKRKAEIERLGQGLKKNCPCVYHVIFPDKQVPNN